MIGGVLVVSEMYVRIQYPDERSGAPGAMGYDLATGKRLWTSPPGSLGWIATASRWRHGHDDGESVVIAGNGSGEGAVSAYV